MLPAHDAVAFTGHFSNRSHRSVQHYCIASLDAQLAKLIRQFLCNVSNAVYATADDKVATTGACGLAPLISSHNINAISPKKAG